MQRPRRIVSSLVATGLLACCVLASPAWAKQEPSPPVERPDEQFYVLSFTATPVPEVAEAVIGEALNEAFTVDPAVDGAVDFKVEGWFDDEALLREFGSALLDQDAALVRDSDRSLSVVARANLPFAVARGASVIALPDAAPRPTVAAQAGPSPVIVYGKDRWWDGGWGKAALFLGGLGTGAATVIGGQAALRARRAALVARSAPLMLEASSREPVPHGLPVDGDDLVIPAFETRPSGEAKHRADP